MGDEREEHRAAAALRRYAEGDLSLVDLEAELGGRVTFERPGSPGVVYIDAPLPMITLEAPQLFAALSRGLRGQTTVSDLTSWAATLIVLQCYGVSAPGPDQGVVSSTVWELARAGSCGELDDAKLRALLDDLLDSTV